MADTANAESAINLGKMPEHEQIMQNVRMILSTRRGSVPLYREFGLPMEFLDRPAIAARPMIIAEISEAISTFEPRAKVVSVTFEERGSSGSGTGDNNGAYAYEGMPNNGGQPWRLVPVVELEIGSGM
jgi:phage baseplate assembly protein W